MASDFDIFDQLVAKEDERKLLSLRGSVLTGMDSNPDNAAQALPLAQKQNLPLQTVEKNIDRVRKNGMDNDFFDQMIKRSPSTADFLSTLDNAKISHDDIGYLEGIEKVLVDTPQAYAQGARDLELNKDVGQKIIAQTATKRDLGYIYYNNKDRRDDFGTGSFVSNAVTGAAETLPMTLSSTGKYVAGYGGGFLTGTALAFLFGQAGPQVAVPEEIVTVPTLGHTLGNVGGKLASAYDIYLAESGGAAIELQGIKDENGQGLDPDTVTGTAVAVGLINSGLEMVSLKALAKTLPGGEDFIKGQFGKLGLRKLLKDQAARDTFRRIGAAYMKSIGTEITTETLQEFSNIAGEELAKLFSEGNFKAATVGEVAERIGSIQEKTFYASVGLGFPGTAIRAGTKIAQQNNTIDPSRMAAWAQESAQAVRESKLLARSPQKFREYMGKVVGDRKFYMNAEQAERFYQSVTPEQQADLAENIPGFADAIEQARLTGTDVELNQADYFSFVVPLDEESRLSEYVKMSPEEYSIGELRDSEDISAELLAGLAEEQNGRAEQTLKAEAVEQRYYEQLLNTGQTPDAARLNALRLRKAYETFSARYGDHSVEAQDLIDKMLGQLAITRKFRDLESKMPVNHMDLFVDRARGYVQKLNRKFAGDEKRRATAIRKAEERARATGRPFKMPRFGKRSKSLNRLELPVLDFLAQRGGVKPGSPLAQELATMDVTPKNAGWLFNENGVGAADNIDISAFPQTFDRPVQADEAQADYVDQQYVLDQVREELFGNPIGGKSVDSDEQLYGDFLQVLSDLGIDILEASNDDIKKALNEAQQRYNEGGDIYQQGPVQESAADFSDRISKELGVDVALHEGNGVLTLAALKVQEGERSQGVGSQAMAAITAYADKRGLKLALTPTKDFGASSIKRLTDFYKRFGFVNNKGRNKDFATRETMIREPVQVFNQSVFHGSPHNFKKFTLDHIGKGEGAQAFGWGLYFSSKKAVAEYYQNTLSAKNMLIDGVAFQPGNYRITEIVGKNRNKNKLISELEKYIKEFNDNPYADTKDAQTILDAIKEGKFSFENDEGQLYEVNIPEDENFLHWDKKLNEQPVIVTNSLSKIITSLKKSFPNFDETTATGQGLYEAYRAHRGGNAETASRAFNDFGIKGIKYLDGVSRSNTEGTYNYVIFDDASIEILNTFYQGEKGRGPRGQIEFFTEQARITLFEEADLSTVIHEEGHLYWTLLQKIGGLEEAQQLFPDAQKDVEAVRAWVGAEQGQKLTVDQEEQIARGFEAYLLKGEAPSMELRSAFQRFKAWLTAIYKEIKSLNVNVTPKIAAVFDRMLATDAEIEALADNVEFKADDKVLAMLTEAEKAKYLRNQERALSHAKDKMFAKALQQAEKTLKKWWKQERAKVREETQKRVESSALYRLTDFLQKGVFRDAEGNIIEGVERQKLDKKRLVSLYGKEVLAYLPRGVVSDKGMAPDALAELFGFDTASQMIDAMMRMEDKKARIERITDEEMRERYGDMLNDGTIGREAQEAFTNEYRQYVLELEVKTLAKAANMPVPQGTTFKIKAEQILDNKQVRELIPYRYYRAGIKAARAAGVALGKQDYVTAAIQKQKQLLNHHLYKLSSERKNMLEKKFKKWDRLVKRSDKDRAKTHDIDYIYAARAILARNGIGRTDFNFSAWMENLRLDDPDTAEMLQHAIDTFAQDAKDYRQMTWQEFVGLSDAVDNILGVAKERRTVVINGQKQSLDEAAANIRDTIYENVPVIRHPVSPRRDRTQAGGFIRGIVGVTKKIQTHVEKMDGGKRFGVVYQALRDGVTQGEVQNAIRQKEEAKRLKAIFERYFGEIKIEDVPFIGDYTATFEELGESGTSKLIRKATFNRVDLAEKVYIPEIGEAYTREQIIAVALNYGNEDNITKLKNGMKADRGVAWEDSQVDAVLRNMRKKDWEFVQEIWDMLESYWPESVALDRRTVGFAAPKIQARPFTVRTIDGETVALRGGYYPLKYDSLKSGRIAANEIDQTFREMRTGQYTQAKTRRGRTKERIDNVEEPVRLDLDVISDAIKETITDLTMREAVENTRKILSHRDVKAAIEQTMGPDVYQSFNVWLQDTAVGGMFADGEFGMGLRGIRHSLTISGMGFKLATTLLQPTGLIQTASELGTKWTMKGFYRYLSAGRYGPFGAAVQVQEISPYMRTRAFTMSRDVADSMRRLLKGGIVNDTQGLFFVTIQKTQQIVDTITWLGAYEKAVSAEGLEGDQAVRFADLAVETSQGSGLMSSLAPIERGTVSATSRLSEGWKTWTVFYSYFNAKINIAMRKTQQTDFRNPYEAAKLAGDYFLLFWLETLVGNALIGRLPDFEDEDDEDKAFAMFSYFMGQGLATVASGFPVISNFASSISGFGSSTGATRGIEDVAKGAKAIYNEGVNLAEGEDINWYNIAQGVNTAGVYLSPYKWPAGQINVALRAAERSAEGEEVAPIDYLISRPHKN